MMLEIIMLILGVISGALLVAALVGRKIVLTIEEIARRR